MREPVAERLFSRVDVNSSEAEAFLRPDRANDICGDLEQPPPVRGGVGWLGLGTQQGPRGARVPDDRLDLAGSSSNTFIAWRATSVTNVLPNRRPLATEMNPVSILRRVLAALSACAALAAPTTQRGRRARRLRSSGVNADMAVT